MTGLEGVVAMSAAPDEDAESGGDAATPVEDATPDLADQTITPADTAIVVSEWQEYVFDPAHVAIATSLIDDAAAADPSIAELQMNGLIADAVRDDASVDEAFRRELCCTFLYKLRIDRIGDQPSAGATLEPQTANQPSFLRPITAVTDDVAKLWEALTLSVTHDRPLARLRDLLFSARRGDVGEHGRRAIAHYLAAAPAATDHDRVEILLRVWTIARSMRSDADELTVRAEMWQCVQAHASRADGGAPGYTLPLLNALLVMPRDTSALATEPDIDVVLDDLNGKYDSDHVIDRIAAFQRKRTAGDRAKLEAIDRRRVQARFDRAAGATSGLVRMTFLQDAATLARDLGIEDMADRAVVEMQNIKPDELEWIRIAASAAVPTDMYEAYVRVFDFDPDWRVGLAEWLATRPPSGVYRDNVRAARERAKGSILRHLFGNVAFGAHGLPQQSSGTDAAIDRDVRQGEATSARNHADLLAIALDRIRALDPALTDRDVSEWLVATYGADEALASRFARSLISFWEGRYDEAAHTVASIVEAGARSLLRELDEPLYRVEKGKTIGQFPGLGAMLPKLHSRGLDKDWERFLEVVLLPEGINLRNILAHGLAARLGRIEAVLLLRAAGLLVVIAPPDGSARDAQEVECVLRTVPRPTPRSLRRRVEAAVRAAAWELRR